MLDIPCNNETAGESQKILSCGISVAARMKQRRQENLFPEVGCVLLRALPCRNCTAQLAHCKECFIAGCRARLPKNGRVVPTTSKTSFSARFSWPEHASAFDRSPTFVGWQGPTLIQRSGVCIGPCVAPALWEVFLVKVDRCVERCRNGGAVKRIFRYVDGAGGSKECWSCQQGVQQGVLPFPSPLPPDLWVSSKYPQSTSFPSSAYLRGADA